MDNYIKEHVDEIYATGKTTFRDVNGEYEDHVVEFDTLVRGWASMNNSQLSSLLKCGSGDVFFMSQSFRKHAQSEIKQLCIDYYGDE